MAEDQNTEPTAQPENTPEILQNPTENNQNEQEEDEFTPSESNPRDLYLSRKAYYRSAAQMERKIEEFFSAEIAQETITKLSKKGEVVTYTRQKPRSISALAEFLGFRSKRSLQDYCEKNNQRAFYAHILIRAISRCEIDVMHGALVGDYEPRTSALILQSCHGFITRQETKLDASASILSMVVQAVKSAPAIDVTPEKAKGAAVGDKIRTAVQQKK